MKVVILPLVIKLLKNYVVYLTRFGQAYMIFAYKKLHDVKKFDIASDWLYMFGRT